MTRLSHASLFVFLCVLSLILWIRPFLSTIALAVGQDGYTHILLILPISATLILLEWKHSRLEPRLTPLGGGLLAIALLLAAFAKWGPVQAASEIHLSISMAGLIFWWIGSFVFCYGVEGLRKFLFPIFFLFWMVPLPTPAMNRVVTFLQQTSAAASQFLFWLARVPVSREGIVLLIPGLEIEVAAECSSIRSSVMLVVTTMLLAQLFLHSPWRKLLVIAVSLPLCVAKNGLRIFTIALLGTRVDPAYLDGWLHHHGGIIFFLIAEAVIFLLLWILRRGEDPGTAAPLPALIST